MYRRLVTFALLVVTVAVTTLVVPLGLAARDLIRSQNLSAMADQARVLADAWEAVQRSADGEDDSEVPVIDLPGRPGEVVLAYPDGTSVGGPVPAGAASLVASARLGRPASADLGEGYAAAPATFDEEQVGVVLLVADSATMQTGLAQRLAALAGLSAALLLGAGAAAWLLARRTARPIRELASTADALAAGDLDARAAPSEIREVADVGVALNRMALRVQELLADERAATAELAHQLRTPLTVLAADVDAVSDDQLRARLAEDVLTLQRTTDEIINAARRPAREGLRASCDAASVVAARAEFWRVLADFQGRSMDFRGWPTPLPVRLTEDDLTTAVDVLLQNVFVHTEEGVPFSLGVRPASGLVEVTVSDGGPGFRDGVPADRPGTTSLGLAIAERLAAASGGHLERGAGRLGGAHVALLLGPSTA